MLFLPDAPAQPLARVITPGPATSVQDLGRQGLAHLGLAQGGALDMNAHAWANHLLGNPVQAASLEITCGGLRLEILQTAYLACVGAPLQMIRNQKIIPMQMNFQVQAGDQLSFTYQGQGMRSYLAVAGGWQVPVCFGSRSTVLREACGGFQGRFLQAQDLLKGLPQITSSSYSSRGVGRTYQGWPLPKPLVLRILPSYQVQDFSPYAQHLLSQHTYQVSPQSNRMGYRLTGEVIPTPATNYASEGITLGAIQIPSDGQPIILLRERQNVGGYAKIGTVLPRDLDKLAQCPAYYPIRFTWITEKEMPSIYAQHQAWLDFFGLTDGT
ncbi:biotin-dependent carboxylase uncharacterized domain-containing protein [Allopseudospirillum japonicum]|uniref:Biotin-dependent carboxylase uncharacterized domain-containing protein n=1 Tax=Allopseudospirillum japonicum TaxID=64971 RepID=A0A1H6T9R7_9GAMM|nr:biotin-dependent carboxyltransferase family protein [Allopseudospirillum japonicum]SEI72582.1 biotin-dependent carboxylase uncharacterized domain-containing protein [Allopseudospirillum japonicum]